MKGKVAHRVPLSPRAVAILREMEKLRTGETVFPISYDSLKKWLPTLHEGITLHGFRSAFRDWASLSGVRDDVAELSLAHNEGRGSKTVKAYLRDDLLELRRPLMADWAEWCQGNAEAPVKLQAQQAA
jgi:integrase